MAARSGGERTHSPGVAAARAEYSRVCVYTRVFGRARAMLVCFVLVCVRAPTTRTLRLPRPFCAHSARTHSAHARRAHTHTAHARADRTDTRARYARVRVHTLLYRRPPTPSRRRQRRRGSQARAAGQRASAGRDVCADGNLRACACCCCTTRRFSPMCSVGGMRAGLRTRVRHNCVHFWGPPAYPVLRVPCGIRACRRGLCAHTHASCFLSRRGFAFSWHIRVLHVATT